MLLKFYKYVYEQVFTVWSLQFKISFSNKTMKTTDCFLKRIELLYLIIKYFLVIF